MAEDGDHLTILPRAVRKYEVEQAALFAGGPAFEQRLRIAGKFENPHTLVHVGLLGLLVAVDVVLQALLFLWPCPRHLVEEIAPDLAVKLVDIHGADQRATARWYQMLTDYQQPELKPGIQAALEDFVSQRKAQMPDEWY